MKQSLQDDMKTVPSLVADIPMVVVFGKAGAGKSTIANCATNLLLNRQHQERTNPKILHLDLDICVPQWMRDNFSKGIYPTLEERETFAMGACDYVHEQISKTTIQLCEKQGTEDDCTRSDQHQGQTTKINTVESIHPPCYVLISFSFVNEDLRQKFQSRFPSAKWALVDVTDEVAQERIDQREGHFYKGAPSALENKSTNSQLDSSLEKGNKNKAEDNDEWKFAPVTFDHLVLDGLESERTNAERVILKLVE